ncbi:MAG: hypothetical protein ABIR28_10580 [Vicinamibacteria bacterium]
MRLAFLYFIEVRPMTRAFHQAVFVAATLSALGPPVVAQSPAVDEFKAQRALFNYNATVPLGVSEKGMEKREGATVRDVTFDALTGKSLAAYIVTPEGNGPFAAVLWVHWLGEPATTNRTEFLNEATKLASQGIVSVLVDTMWSTAVNPDWFGKRVPEEDYANSIKQVVTLRRGMDLLMSQPNIDKARVGVVGHDFGGMYSMMMAGVDQRAKTYVYVAVVPSLNDWAFLGPQPKSKTDYLRQNAPLELTDYLRQVKNATTFLQFGNKDVFISRVDTGIIARAAGIPQKEIATHRKFYDVDHGMNLPEVVADRDAWLLKELSLQPAR